MERRRPTQIFTQRPPRATLSGDAGGCTSQLLAAALSKRQGTQSIVGELKLLPSHPHANCSLLIFGLNLLHHHLPLNTFCK